VVAPEDVNGKTEVWGRRGEVVSVAAGWDTGTVVSDENKLFRSKLQLMVHIF